MSTKLSSPGSFPSGVSPVTPRGRLPLSLNQAWAPCCPVTGKQTALFITKAHSDRKLSITLFIQSFPLREGWSTAGGLHVSLIIPLILFPAQLYSEPNVLDESQGLLEESNLSRYSVTALCVQCLTVFVPGLGLPSLFITSNLIPHYFLSFPSHPLQVTISFCLFFSLG